MTAVKQTIIDSTDANNVYYGSADLGRATSSNFWSIYRKNTNGSVVTNAYPIGLTGSPSEKENFVWDERALYNYSLTDDVTAPTLSTVTIASNNSTTTLAKVGDIVTLTIVSSEIIEVPTVTIGAGSATVTTGIDEKHYTAARTMTSADVNGTVTFSIVFEDIGSRAGVTVTALTGGSAVTFDKTVPTLSTVSIASNNANTALAKEGDTVTVTIISSESLKTKPTFTIATHAIDAGNVTQGIDASHWTATYVMVAGDATGAVPFTINGFDLAGNALVAVSTVTDASSVTYDKTLPILASVTETNVTTLNVLLSELAITGTITKANDGGFVVYETGTPATTYAVSAIAPGVDNTHVVLTVADMTASALTGVTITYVAGGNGTVSDLAGNLLATDAVGVVTGAF